MWEKVSGRPVESWPSIGVEVGTDILFLSLSSFSFVSWLAEKFVDLPYLKDGLIYSRKNWASRRLIIS